MSFWDKVGPVSGIGLSLILFGIFYNWFTSWAKEHGFNEGYTWLLVVLGVAITLLASGPVVGWGNVLVLFIFFACSGSAMAIGDIWRHVKAIREFEQHHNGNETS